MELLLDTEQGVFQAPFLSSVPEHAPHDLASFVLSISPVDVPTYLMFSLPFSMVIHAGYNCSIDLIESSLIVRFCFTRKAIVSC